MALSATLTALSLDHKTSAPVVRTGCAVLPKSGATWVPLSSGSGRFADVPLLSQVAVPLPNNNQNDKAKSRVFRLVRADPLYVRYSVSYSASGSSHNFFIYAEVHPTLSVGKMVMRLKGTDLTLLSGPMRLLSSTEARGKLGNQFSAKKQFLPKRHATLCHIRMSGMVEQQDEVLTSTVDEAGNPVTVNRRRRKRQLG